MDDIRYHAAVEAPLLPAFAGHPAPLARTRRRATVMDRARARALVARIEAGEDDLDAFWAVASDPKIGLQRYRGAKERPEPIVLMRKLAALLERAAPELVATARDTALTRLAGLGDDAVRAVQEVATGDIADGRIARARLDAAKTILGALGIGDRPPPVIATQVNVSTPIRGVPEGA